MSGAEDPAPDYLTPSTPALNQRVKTETTTFDPLRLCVFSTVALLTCIFGPVSLLFFSILAIRGYTRARSQGLRRSQCKLGDIRTVIAYLSVLVVLSAAAIPVWVMALMKIFS